MKPLVVTDAAKQDLRDIAAYSRHQWGMAQERRYMQAFRDAFVRIRGNPASGAVRDDVRSGYRSMAVGHHIVFYRDEPDRIFVLRVLHERMDIHGRLSDEP
jgi:toxin ParE1/3/4